MRPTLDAKREALDQVRAAIQDSPCGITRQHLQDLLEIVLETDVPAAAVRKTMRDLLEPFSPLLQPYVVRLAGGELRRVQRSLDDVLIDLADYPAMKDRKP